MSAIVLWREILGKLNNSGPVSQSDAIDISIDIIKQYPKQWEQLLNAKGLVMNPESDDVTDIGTLDGAVFTPLPTPRKVKIAGLVGIRFLRYILAEISGGAERKHGNVLASDDGFNQQQLFERMFNTGKTRATTLVGDPLDETED